jgi:hypothetical protein
MAGTLVLPGRDFPYTTCIFVCSSFAAAWRAFFCSWYFSCNPSLSSTVYDWYVLIFSNRYGNVSVKGNIAKPDRIPAIATCIGLEGALKKNMADVAIFASTPTANVATRCARVITSSSSSGGAKMDKRE